MELSYLHYSVYKTCPLQYKWKFVEKPPFHYRWDKRNAFIGLVLQMLVVRFYLEKWWQEKDPLLRMRQAISITMQQFMTADNIYFTDQEIEKWKQIAWDACEMIIGVIKAEKLLTDTLYVEREEEIPFGEDKLQAKPDLVIVFKSGFIILLDGKGGGTVGKYVDDDQLYFYCIVIEKVYGKLPNRIGWWWYRHGKVVWKPLTLQHVLAVENKARSIIDGIKAKQFEATPGDHCRLCDFRVGCKPGQMYLDNKHPVCDVELPEGNYGEVGF